MEYVGQETRCDVPNIDQYYALDRATLLAAQAGSQLAFAKLQDVYGKRLFRAIVAITRNQEDAEDALQDTFLRAFRGLPSFQEKSQLSTWLTRIAINSALMVLRKRVSRSEVPLDHHDEAGEDGPAFVATNDQGNPERIAEQRQRRQKLRSVIKTLDPILRTAILIRTVEGKPIREIAKQLDISEAAAKARIYRARKYLVQARARIV